MLLLPVDVLEYLDCAGHSPYAEWFNALNSQAAAKVAIAVTRIAQGNLSNVKGVVRVQDRLWARLQDLYGQGWRAYRNSAWWR
jgi:putative component of toxin-antitoxin plasmid stabilization module